jgi:hypothetical protein
VGAQITRDSVGIYRTDLDTSTVTSPIEPHEAVVKYRWQGTGTNPFAMEDQFAVNAGAF